MCTFYPKFRELFPEILQVLISHGDAYTPDTVLLGEAHGFQTISFHPSNLDDFFSKWKDESPGQTIWKFEKKEPAGLTFTIGDTLVPYNTLLMQINRDYLAQNRKIEELLELSRELYDMIHPFYGAAWIHEMAKHVDSPLGKVTLGINPERGLPEIEWANFLGPEYVETFGAQKLLLAPFQHSEQLPDGGVLLLLSPSPFDYLSNQEGLDKRRLEIKKHLGLEAFDAGDSSPKHRVPRFRYQEDWKAAQSKLLMAHTKQMDSVSESRKDYEDWIENNESIALAFVSEMRKQGIALDYSENSLDVLDTYIARRIAAGEKWSPNFIENLGAYLSQMILKTSGGVWYFPESEQVPALKVGGVIATPLVRAAKVLQQAEKLGHWYRTLNKMVPRLKVEIRHGDTYQERSS